MIKNQSQLAATSPLAWLFAAVLSLVMLLLAMPASAVTMQKAGDSGEHYLTKPVQTAQFQVLPSIRQGVHFMAGQNVQDEGMQRFLQEVGGEWEVRKDIRSNRPNLIQGSGVPVVPGAGNNLRPADIGLQPGHALTQADLAGLLRDFMDSHAKLLGTAGLEFRFDEEASVPKRGNLGNASMIFNQYYHGVKVDDARVFFRLGQGNITQFGTYRVAPVNVDTTPSLPMRAAFDHAFKAMPLRSGATLDRSDKGELLIMPTIVEGELPGMRYAGAPGQGYGHRLVWRFVFTLKNDPATYEILVDAHSNKLLRISNLNRHVQATVTGGIYPTSPLDQEANVAFPFVTVQNGTVKNTNLEGHYDYSGGTASTSLNGQFFVINDNCGSISLSNSSTGNLDFGFAINGTDCDTPGFGGAGNTNATRNAFYFLTLINRKAYTYHPTNSWINSKVQVNVNVNQACNAAWSPGDGTLNFYQSGTVNGTQCANTGELRGVFLHEWGHGFDQNSGTGSAPEMGSGEAFGDTIGFTYTHLGCLGHGFFNNPSDCYNCNTGCTGVRDVSAFSTRGPAATTIAKPSTVLDPNGIAAPTSCPYTVGFFQQPYHGPMGYEGHRESLIASSANWDLAMNLVDEYGSDQGWEQMNTIWYYAATDIGSAYQVASGGQCNPNASVDGCGSDNWYTVFLQVDDAEHGDGNLANGTPNACRIWDAFNAHGIACGARPVCTSGAAPGFGLSVAQSSQAMCTPGSASYTIDVSSMQSFNNPVTLAASGLPSGLSASFAPNPVTPGTSSTLTLAGTAGLAAGSYTITVNGSATGADPKTVDVYLDVSAGTPGTPVLSSPADGASGVDLVPTLSWQAVAGASGYHVQVATDAGFGNIIVDQTGITGTSFAAPGLSPATTYYWRVSAESSCGSSSFSASASFTTANLICSAPGVAIPDGNVTGVSDSITLSQPGNLQGMQVQVRASHPWVGDLIFELSNGSSTVILMDQPGVPGSTYGCSGEDVDVTFDDNATSAVESACNSTAPAIGGTLKPEQSINATFAGQPLAGTWTLTAKDNGAALSGMLDEWCLIPATDDDTIFEDGFDGEGGGNPPAYQQPVQDPGFEATTSGGGTNPHWNFGDNQHTTSPFCDNSCAGSGTVPTQEGSFVTWFGGWGPAIPLTQTISQTVTISSGGPRYLNFYEYLATVPTTQTSLVVKVGSTVLATYDIDQQTQESGYNFVSLPIPASLADDGTHTITFEFENQGGTSGATANLFIDMVTVSDSNTANVTGRMPTVPAVNLFRF